jgi:2-C-methyl-D-erythritol 4-phosphate cytidylyltransferase
MGGAVPKQFLLLGNRPLLVHALQVFERTRAVAEVILVVPRDEQSRTLTQVVERYGIKKVLKVVVGGATRQESVRQGLEATDDTTDIVVVHDAVRPFVTEELITRSVEVAREKGAAVVAVPVRDTLKEAGPDGLILRTVDRSDFWLAQTPQTFQRPVLFQAYQTAGHDRFHATDDAALVEHIGHPVGIVPGRWDNIKITTPDDLIMGEAILAWRAISEKERSTNSLRAVPGAARLSDQGEAT